jgi:hypothetical protein
MNLSDDPADSDELIEPAKIEERAGPPPVMPAGLSQEDKYLNLLLTALRTCLDYKPRFGQGRLKGISFEEFRELYGNDPFYHWMGIDSPLMYAAHKAAGGMTSVYRQIGIGAQWVFFQMLQDELGLSAIQAGWKYSVASGRGKRRTLSLDGRIDIADIRDTSSKKRITKWICDAEELIGLPRETCTNIKGVVFETRQGYKSKDSKRQNADIANAAKAYAHLYIPVLLLFSNQIDGDVASRYRESLWLLLSGTTQGATTTSTYAFCRDVVGYDLGGFFERNSARLRKEIEKVLRTLLSP